MQIYKTFNTRESQDMTPEQVVDMIRHDEQLKQTTQTYRDLMARGMETEARRLKTQTPQAAVSFRMEGGRSKDCCREALGMVLIDFDAKQPGERLEPQELERVKTLMRTSYHALIGYESISAMGYHVVVPYVLPEGVSIDLQANRRQAEELYGRVYRHICNLYGAWCGHPMDLECKNTNRMAGLAHDPQAVLRDDVRPIRLTRRELGIGDDGQLLRWTTDRHVERDAGGRPVAVALGDHLEQAVRTLREGGMEFVSGQRHNFVMRVAFLLNRMGVDEDEAAQAVDAEWLGRMDGRPSDVLHSCYRTAQDEFGTWRPRRSATEVKTELMAQFLGQKALQYDVLTQKTRQQTADGRWRELTERDENDLYMACCAQSDKDLSLRMFLTVLNSSVVPEVNPLREYLLALPAWDPAQPDYILEAAQTVHMATPHEQQLWLTAFRKWFVAMTAGWLRDDVVNHQVIVLVGRQGIYKSTWINRLLPPRLAAYTTDNINVDDLNKDEQLRAAEYGLINIDELDKLTDRQLNKLKSMVTQTHVDVRASYGRHKEKRVRMASYAASGNKQEFLTDQTGNRRWLPFHVDSIDSPFTHTLPYDGMYAQALHLLSQGFNYWFDEADTSLLQAHVDAFMIPTSEEELLKVYFEPAEEGTPGATFLTLPEIAAKLTAYGNLRKEVDHRKLGAILTRLGYTKRRQGHSRARGFVMREHSAAEIELLRNPGNTINDGDQDADDADKRTLVF